MSATQVRKGIWVLVAGRYPTRFAYHSLMDDKVIMQTIVGAMSSVDWAPLTHPLPDGKWKITEIPLTPRKPDEDVLIRDMLKAIKQDLSKGKYDDGQSVYAAIDKVEICLEYLDRYKRAWRMVNGKKQWFRLVPDYDVDDADES